MDVHVQLLTWWRNAAANKHQEMNVTQAKIPLFLAASALALGLVACGPENPASEARNATEVALDDNTTVATETVDPGVINFVEKASLSGMYEIESAKLALERSKVQSVKDFAQAMLDAHTTASNELKPLAAGALVTPPTQLDNHFTGQLDQLREASVEDFDDRYIDQQTEAHENTLSLMKDFAANGKDASLQAFAQKMTPVVEAHLTQVKALDDSPADDVTKAPS
jgi:putative membrane protein